MGANPKYVIKRGDLLPLVTEQLRDGEGRPVDLTGALAVRFIYRIASKASPAVVRDATVVSAVLGLVRYEWQVGDVTTAGRYNAEWEVTFASGKPQTFPGDGFAELWIPEDLDSSGVASPQALITFKFPVQAASIANVAGVYNATGGSSGRGQFTSMPNYLDGVALTVGMRLLLAQQTAPAQNGLWVVTTVGSGANGVWNRASDMDADGEAVQGVSVWVAQGQYNRNTLWFLTSADPLVVGGASGSALVFEKTGVDIVVPTGWGGVV